MASQNFFSGMFQPVVLNANGQITVAAGYKAKFYAAGTDIPKAIYTDSALTVPYSTPSNIAFLDDTGKALIYLGLGGYKLVLTDPNDVPVAGYTIDNIQGGNGAFSTGFVDSFADLVNVNADNFAYTYIGGYYEPGDGGEGMFWSATSNDSPDGGYIQDSTVTPSKRWFRIPDENGDVRAASFGYIPYKANSGTYIPLDNLIAADSYASSISAALRIQQGSVSTINSVTLQSPTIKMNEFARFTGNAGEAITINGILQAGDWQVFYGFADVFLANQKQESRPEWFGASVSGTGSNNATAFAAWKAAGAGLFVVPPGTWAHTGTFTAASDRITLFYGSVGSSYIPGTYYGLASALTGNLSLDITGNFKFTGDIDATGVFGLLGDFGMTGELTVNGTSQFNGNATSTSTIEALDIVANETVQAGTNITAGTDGVSGYVRALAGNSTTSFKASGRIASNFTQVATSGTAATNLQSFTLTANSLFTDGDSIRATMCGVGISGGVRTFALKIGATTLLTSSLTVANIDHGWKIVADIIRKTDATAFVNWSLIFNDEATHIAPTAIGSTTVSINFTISNEFQLVGTALSGGSLTQVFTLVDIYPILPSS